MSRERSWTEGEPVKIDGRVGDDRGDYNGVRGRVVGDNCAGTGADGRRKVLIKTERGDVVAVPEGAVRKG